MQCIVGYLHQIPFAVAYMYRYIYIHIQLVNPLALSVIFRRFK